MISVSTMVLGILCVVTNTKGAVDLFVNPGSKNPTACGNSIEFTCTANETNTVSILQNGVQCQIFERGGPIQDAIPCSGLDLKLTRSDTDPANPLLTIFEVEGKQLFQDKIKHIDIECVDANSVNKTLGLQVDSGLCDPLTKCLLPLECSHCMGFSIKQIQQCPGFESITSVEVKANSAAISYNYSDCYCFGEHYNLHSEVRFVLINKCGESSMESSCNATSPDDDEEETPAAENAYLQKAKIPLFALTAALSVGLSWYCG
jgi:hypothetical protein